MPTLRPQAVYNVQPQRRIPRKKAPLCLPPAPLKNSYSPLVTDAIAIIGEWSPSGASIRTLANFVCEVLRRSQFSKHMLETALYYLLKLKPYAEDSEEPALHCARRMFLSALILAGKYVQDRPFSMQAWSKISGLDTRTLAQNELIFLKTINYDLFIPHHGFDSLRIHIEGLRRSGSRTLRTALLAASLPGPPRTLYSHGLISPAVSEAEAGSDSAPDLTDDDENSDC